MNEKRSLLIAIDATQNGPSECGIFVGFSPQNRSSNAREESHSALAARCQVSSNAKMGGDDFCRLSYFKIYRQPHSLETQNKKQRLALASEKNATHVRNISRSRASSYGICMHTERNGSPAIYR